MEVKLNDVDDVRYCSLLWLLLRQKYTIFIIKQTLCYIFLQFIFVGCHVYPYAFLTFYF